MSNVYKKLAKHLDSLPGGFPQTETEVELRILKRLFTPEEAELATHLSLAPEETPAIAERTGREPESLAAMLEEMARKGLIFRNSRNGIHSYSAAMFVIGIWEYHLNDLDEGLVRDVNEYIPHLAKEIWTESSTKQFRVVPVSKEIAPELTITSYEDAEEIIRSQSKITVQPCICRKEHEFVGEACSYPMEVCLSFGSAAFFYEANGLGRAISIEDALKVLNTGREAGLVIQPGNAQRSSHICMCCGCCCQILKNIKIMDKPSQFVHSNYYAEVDESNCITCGDCAAKCHMEAISVDEVAHVNPDRCIGCGVCIPICPSGAVIYKQKESKDLYIPPKNVSETYMKMAQERGV